MLDANDNFTSIGLMFLRIAPLITEGGGGGGGVVLLKKVYVLQLPL